MLNKRHETGVVIGIVTLAVAAALAMLVLVLPAAGQLVISDVTAAPGDTVDVTITLTDNSAQYVATMFDLIVPDVLDPGSRSQCGFVESHNDGGSGIASRTAISADVRLLVIAHETVTFPVPVGEIARCRFTVPVDAAPGSYVIGCADPQATTCPDAEANICGLELFTLDCPPAMVVIEAPTPTATATLIPPTPTRVVAGGPNVAQQVEVGGSGGGCQIGGGMPQDSPATWAMLGMGLLAAVMVRPRN